MVSRNGLSDLAQVRQASQLSMTSLVTPSNYPAALNSALYRPFQSNSETTAVSGHSSIAAASSLEKIVGPLSKIPHTASSISLAYLWIAVQIRKEKIALSFSKRPLETFV